MSFPRLSPHQLSGIVAFSESIMSVSDEPFKEEILLSAAFTVAGSGVWRCGPLPPRMTLTRSVALQRDVDIAAPRDGTENAAWRGILAALARCC